MDILTHFFEGLSENCPVEDKDWLWGQVHDGAKNVGLHDRCILRRPCKGMSSDQPAENVRTEKLNRRQALFVQVDTSSQLHLGVQEAF